jgi:hypothetical protein
MTFATHLERQFMQPCDRLAGQSECSASEPATRANAATKRLDRNNKIRPEKRGPLSADRRGFGG